MTEQVDAIVVGAGVVGLAVARALALAGREVVVLEQNNSIGEETSSRNSEVIHAGIYYSPGSLKARLCTMGRDMMYAYCAARGIAHRRCGKLIVASDSVQIESLQKIEALGRAHQVTDLRWLDKSEIRRMEPEIVVEQALFSPSTGIVDSHEFMTSLQGDLENAGGMVVSRSPVTGLRTSVGRILVSTGGPDAMDLSANICVNAAGLGAQRLGGTLKNPCKIPPLHYAIGHYYSLSGKSPFQHLIYPVPDKGGLGVHVTLDLAGQARFGPDVRWRDTIDYAFDDSERESFIAAIRTYFPGLDADRLQTAYTGIRPKLTGPGEAVADFVIETPEVNNIPGLVQLFGIESPGLTASMAIAQEVLERLDLPTGQ